MAEKLKIFLGNAFVTDQGDWAQGKTAMTNDIYHTADGAFMSLIDDNTTAPAVGAAGWRVWFDEKGINNAEQARVEAESSRQQTEIIRESNESNRQKAESSRVEAEASRNKEEAKRKDLYERLKSVDAAQFNARLEQIEAMSLSVVDGCVCQTFEV